MKGTLLDLAKNRPDTESQVNERLEPSKRAPTKTRSDSQDNGLTLISLPNTTGQQIYEKLAHHTHTPIEEGSRSRNSTFILISSG